MWAEVHISVKFRSFLAWALSPQDAAYTVHVNRLDAVAKYRVLSYAAAKVKFVVSASAIVGARIRNFTRRHPRQGIRKGLEAFMG
ncbi:hypothetical protein Bpfe_002620 [Biomphalaria pfeifferi]|uniref:Uncharacterized protein n=1 Tax=Biomphalaria pfeifferi TaxID=112525 RepID=A0AAD8C8V1_BIOPF|nr:hypothetical protein Bpfe_002620 [Biomphalaria pfeifferi]